MQPLDRVPRADGWLLLSSRRKIYNENVVDLLSDPSTGGRQSPARKTSPRTRQGSNSVSPAVSPTGGGNGRGGGAGAGSGDGGFLLKPVIRENKVKFRVSSQDTSGVGRGREGTEELCAATPWVRNKGRARMA